MNTSNLETLIEQYEAEIYGDANSDRLEQLAVAVESEADRIDYDNHQRLMTLHTAAEHAVARSQFLKQ